MPVNFDGQFEARFFYSVTLAGRTLPHKLTIDVNVVSPAEPGLELDTYEAVERGGQVVSVGVALAAFSNLLRPFYTVAEANFNRWELWYIPEGTTNGQFLSSAPVTLQPNGTGNCIAAQQSTLTFRSINGGVMRIQLMEGNIPGNSRDELPIGNVNVTTLANVVTGTGSVFLARDNSAPFVGLAFSSGQNEALARKRFRSQ